MSDFTMPSLGADMDQGTLLEWLVSPGDHVHKGDPVAVVDTSKAAIEVEVFEDGVVGELLVPPGTTVQVGTPLARIDAPQAAAPRPAATPTSPSAPPRPARSSVRATPLARRLAEELGVDIDRLGRPEIGRAHV